MIQHTNLGTHSIGNTSWIIYAPVKTLIGKVVKTSFALGPNFIAANTPESANKNQWRIGR
jgi:hypothetical protein